MKNVDISNVRTFAVAGHSGSGKTTLVDALLFKLGVNDRLGSADAGSSMADWTDAEKERRITLQAKPFSGTFKSGGGRQAGMVFCDTPGYMDFYGQVVSASRVCESALVVVDAVGGVQVGTNKAWRRATELDLPRAVVVTGLDKDNADFDRVLSSIQAAWGKKCVPVVLPLPDGSGVVDILNAQDVSGDMADTVAEAKSSLVELAAETDDSLIEKYLGGEALSAEEIANGLRSSVDSVQFVPVFACMPLKDAGIAELLEGMLRLMPSPLDRKPKDKDGNEVDPSPDAPFSGFVWRTVNDPYVGQLTFVKVRSGTLKSDSEIFNSTKGEKERIAQLLVVNGQKQTSVDEAHAGEIVALTKLKHTKLSDTLCAAGQKIEYAPLVFPGPLAFFAVNAKSRDDEDKLGVALSRVADEDPTIKVERNTETHEMLLSGMGDVHLEVAVAQMKTRSNVEVVLSIPKVPYREAITSTAEGHYKHKKQTGGRGQYAEVYVRVKSKLATEDEWFANEIVGGAIPGNFIPAVQKGLVEGMSKGTVAGYKVTNVEVALYDGSFHDVDSSEVAFKIAGARAFKDAMAKAKPVLLEPIMSVKIMVPEKVMGDVSGDVSHKRGRIMGVGVEDGMQLITAEVPRAELSRYCAELRSMTGGQGTFDMSFIRYDVVPGNVAEKIVADANKEKEAEA